MSAFLIVNYDIDDPELARVRIRNKQTGEERVVTHERGAELRRHPPVGHRGRGRFHPQVHIRCRQELQAGVVEVVPLALLRHAFAAEQAADDVDALVLAVALGHRIDAEGVGVGRQGAGP